MIVDSPDVAAPLIDVLDVADVGAWMWVEAERSLYFSPRVLDLLGLDPEPHDDLLTRFFQSVHVDDQDPVRTLLLGAAPNGPFCLRYRYTPATGPLRWIEDRGRVERDASGTLIRQGGAMRDVTDEVGRELERREADARLEALVNAMPFAVWGRSGPSLTVTHQNAASIAAWGDMRGHTLADAPADVRAVWGEQLAEVMSGQAVRVRREQRIGGDVHTLEEIIAPVIVEDQVTGAVGVALDVSDDARATRFQSLLTELSADFAGRTTASLDAALVEALEKLARFIGAPMAVLGELGGGPQADRLHLTHWWIDPATGQHRPREIEIDTGPGRSLFEQVASNQPVMLRSRDELPIDSPQRAWLQEHRVRSFVMVPTRHIDGTATLLGLAGANDSVVDWPPDTVGCLRLAATLLSGVLARARADAAHKAAERRMQDAQKLESLGVLAGGIAHDFNNLLTAILGNASLLRLELHQLQEAAEAVDQVDQIETASRRAAELCRQMLAYAGRGRFALQLIDLNDLLRDMQAALEVSAGATARLTLDLAPDLPVVLADESQMRQLIMNLVFNAVEALEAGGTITLRTSSGQRTAAELANTVFSPQLPDGSYVSLSVSDTGHGMTPQTAARIFDPFFSTRFTGRGLGLAAVVGIVRAHQGALRVESEVQVGSTFELLLPAHEGRPEPPPRFAASPQSTLATWQTSGTVLVIDDERGVRDLVRSSLSRNGFTIVEADTGERGIALFERNAGDFRLVLVDLTMPGMDGRETLAAIRRLRSDIPAIVMSGYSPADLINSTSDEFLQKPFTPGVLRTVIKRLLGE